MRIDCSAPAPRVAFEQLGKFIGKRVRLLGEVVSVAGGVAQVKAADEGMVSVKVQGAAPTSRFAEFEGVVRAPDSLEEESHVPINGAVDMANYNELCKLIHGQYRTLFF